MRRVVVTGIGVVAPNGVGLKQFSEALRSGRSAIRSLSRFSHPDFSRFLAAEIPPGIFSLNGLDRSIVYGLKAVEEALQESALPVSSLPPEEVGVVFSSSKGGMSCVEKALSPTLMEQFPTSSVSSEILRHYPFRGPALNWVAACATGTHALIRAFQLIQDGYASFVIAGSSDASITPLLLSGYAQMGALSHEGMFPFDRRRSGFVVGEGAAAFVLEERKGALKRGAPIYGEMAGYAMGQDPSHPLRFNEKDDTLARVLRNALERSGVAPEKIDYVNAHGTATVAGDRYETKQLKQAFGNVVYQIPISSTKSMTGHLLGAAGSVELAATFLAMEQNFIPPTIGLSEKDPACDLDYVPNEARQKPVRTALSVSMGFGGHIGVIVVKK